MTPVLSETVAIEVPFHDVDSMGVVWHARKWPTLTRVVPVRS